MVGNGLCGLRKSGNGDVLAARNYWGAATGPGNTFFGEFRMMRAISHDRPLALPDVSNSTH